MNSAYSLDVKGISRFVTMEFRHLYGQQNSMAWHGITFQDERAAAKLHVTLLQTRADGDRNNPGTRVIHTVTKKLM